jgi:hypothetical protein
MWLAAKQSSRKAALFFMNTATMSFSPMPFDLRKRAVFPIRSRSSA